LDASICTDNFPILVWPDASSIASTWHITDL
jgi:hypothetical protein